MRLARGSSGMRALGPCRGGCDAAVTGVGIVVGLGDVEGPSYLRCR